MFKMSQKKHFFFLVMMGTFMEGLLTFTIQNHYMSGVRTQIAHESL